MPDLPIRYFRGRDGVRLAYRELGEGLAVVLIHGYFSNGLVNWVNYGHAAAIAARGLRVIMPDLRGHGTAPSRTTRPPIRRTCWPTTGSR